MMPASQFFKGSASSDLELTEEELATAEAVRVRDTLVVPSCRTDFTVHMRFVCSHSLELGICAGLGDNIGCPLLVFSNVPRPFFLSTWAPGFGSSEFGFSRDSLPTVNK